ncbi:MAG: LysR family transcriptional regulator [Propionibacteriaceae bacterium]|nr:LysR family transcriptional regulator [Propionibacteriaceae bacterium]
MGVDTDALRWFQEVADGVTVTEVSELTRTSQSGVSRALAKLEAEVGTPLLRLSGRTLRMTEAGAAFKHHVDAMIHQLDDGLAAVQQIVDPESGTITLSFESWLGAWLVPSLVAQFRLHHPSVRFDLVPHYAGAITTPRSRGDIDLELTTNRPAPSSFGWQRVAREPLRVVVSAAHPLARESEVELADLAEASFVALRVGTSLREVTDDLCTRAGFSPQVDIECDDLATLHGFVASGLGIAVTPWVRDHESAGHGVQGAVRFLNISDVHASLDVGIAWALHRHLLPATKTFLAHVVERGDRHRDDQSR